MKRMFTRLTGSIMLLALLLVGFSSKAQTTLASNATLKTIKKDSSATATAAEVKPAAVKAEVKPAKAAEDTSWKPQRRIWGYSFGDFYYNAHADAGNRGAENNYNSVPQYRNAFQLRRIYLGYDYEITKKFKVELLLASEPGANTGTVGATSTSKTTITGGTPGETATTTTTTTTNVSNSDNLVDNKMAFFIKNINLRIRDIWTGTDLVIGEQATPGFALNEPGTNGPVSLAESTWGYRSIEKTITDIHKNNSYDLGASLQGTFDPATKNFGYVFMVGNNSTANLLSAANANTGFYKIFYGDIWGKFLNKKLFVDFYADYARTSPTTAATPAGQEHNMYKIFASYSAKPITIGVEAYTQKFASGVTNGTTKAAEDATAQGLSVWAKGPITKTLNYFARFDTYNPDTDFSMTDSYSVNTNYGSYNPTNKEQFYTVGLDFNPIKNVHLMPNMWLVNYKDQRDASTAGYVGADHNLVYRLTFFYTFGK